MIELSAGQKTCYSATAQQLKGSARRLYMASIVAQLGRGGQRYVERTLGWNRRTVRKGMAELASGVSQVDRFAARGRKRVEARFPALLDDIRAILAEWRQAPAAVRTDQPARKLSVAQVRQQLIEQKGYAAETLPSVTTIRKKLTELGYPLRPERQQHPTNTT